MSGTSSKDTGSSSSRAPGNVSRVMLTHGFAISTCTDENADTSCSRQHGPVLDRRRTSVMGGKQKFRFV